jgi:hypothetical protein
MTSKHKAGVRTGAIATALALGLAIAATAGEGPREGRIKAVQQQQDQAARSEKARSLPSALAKALSRPQNVATTQWADGTVAADLAGTYMNVWIARVNADGSLSHACVNSADAAVQALAGQAGAEVK